MQRKFIALGDVHADYQTMWAALRAASCVDAAGLPTPPVRSGMYQVVLIGDLVHPKSEADYARLIGAEEFSVSDPMHLLRAARAQVSELERLRAYHAAAPHAVHLVLGNHDDAVLDGEYLLGTVGGLVHVEFDPQRGGVMLPQDLREWFGGFLRELRLGRVQFAHVGPLPAMTYYDDLFYGDHSHKRWWHESPEYVELAGLAFGVYGHTQFKDGILINHTARFAMIDALSQREYLEIILDDGAQAGPVSCRAVPF